MNGAWLLPSKGRPGALERFFMHARLMGMTTPGHVLVHPDEAQIYEHLVLPAGWVLERIPADSLAESVRALLPLYKTWDWVGLITDDVVPETFGWDVKILNRVTGGNIVSCNDGAQAPRRMVGAVAFSVPVFRAVGYWYPPGFKHCFVDDIWESLGRECGCWDVDMNVVVRHLHPWITGQKPDATHEHAYSREFWNNDHALFQDWERYVKPESLRRLKEFLSQDPPFARMSSQQGAVA